MDGLFFMFQEWPKSKGLCRKIQDKLGFWTDAILACVVPFKRGPKTPRCGSNPRSAELSCENDFRSLGTDFSSLCFEKTPFSCTTSLSVESQLSRAELRKYLYTKRLPLRTAFFLLPVCGIYLSGPFDFFRRMIRFGLCLFVIITYR